MHSLADHGIAPLAGGRRTRSDGCVVQLVGKPAPSLPANGEGDDIVPLSPEEQGQGRGASAGSVIGALFGILAYVYAARWVTMLAQRRRLVRQVMMMFISTDTLVSAFSPN